MKDNKKKEGFRRKARLQLSFQVGIIVTIICIIFSIYGSAIFIGSLVKLSRKSEDKVIESVGSMISSSQQYNSVLLGNIQALKGSAPITSPEFMNEVVAAIPGGTVTQTQQIGNQILKSSVDNNILGVSLSYYALPPDDAVSAKPVIVIASNDTYIYQEVPGEIAALMKKGGSVYKLFENGIPAMGLKGQYLVSAFKVTGDTTGGSLWYFDFKPMDEMIAEVGGFFARETKVTYFLMFLVLGLSTIGMLIIAIVIMGHLLNRRIAKPIEELSSDAERVMDGDLEVQAAVNPHEDFADLKTVFNQLVSNLNSIVSRSVGQEPYKTYSATDNNRKGGDKYLKPRSTTQVIIVSLFIMVFFLSGLFSIFVVNWCMNRMVTKTEEKLVETEAELMAESHEFGFNMIMSASELTPEQPESYSRAITDFGQAVANRTISKFQELTGMFLKNMVDSGLFGIKLVYSVTPPTPPSIKDYLVLLSSDPKYIYTTPPGNIVDMLQKGSGSWKLFKNGFPQLGLSGECLVNANRFTAELPSGFPQEEISLWSIMYKPMGEQLSAINEFYDKEIHKLKVLNVFSATLSVLTAAIVIWFALSHLIRKKITQPIDELVLAAREVAEGNFDVQIDIRPGEELKSLKRAFNAMIKSIHELIERSMQS